MAEKFRDDSFEKVLLVLLLCIPATYLLTLGWHGLIDPDEGRYAEVAREMLITGDWVTPHLNFVKFFDKPPFLYWLTSASLFLFGQNEFAARLGPAICGIITLGIVFLLSSNLYGKRAGAISSLVLGTSLLYFALAHVVITDMPLTFCITLSLAGFYLGQRGQSAWMAGFYGGMGLGLLAKGLIGVILPLGTVLIWICLTGNRHAFRSLFSLKGVAFAAAISLPWFLLVCSRNPDFFEYFFIRQHFIRYLTTADNRYEPFWFFLPVILFGFLPWTGFLVKSLLPFFVPRKGMRKTMQDRLFLFVWAVFVILFFSFSKSKLIPYILPAFPPLAMLVGIEIETQIRYENRWELLFSVILTFLPLLFCGAAMAALPFFYESYPFWDVAQWSIPAAFILCTGAFVMLYFSRRPGGMKGIVVSLSIAGLLYGTCFAGLAGVYASDHSSKATANCIARHKAPGDLVVQYGGFDQGLPFYLRDRVILLSHSNDMDFGDSHEKDRFWFIDKEGLRNLWNKDQRVFLVARPGDAKTLESLLGPSTATLKVSEKRMVLSNRPVPDDALPETF
jgi:4-amino-4-deoxy-L-arabinose transferase-like glycosyltransferase